MARGRKPTPTALRKLRGNPSKRPLPKREPKPKVDTPPMPTGLSKAAQTHWKHITSECERLKLATTLDHSLLTSYILEWDAVRELAEQCRKHGRWVAETVVDRHGRAYDGPTKRAPWDTSLTQHQQILRGLRSDLGFTPTSRAKVSSVEEEEESVAKLLAFDGGKK